MPPQQTLGFLLYDVGRLLRRNFNRRVQKIGLTQAQWQALVYISRSPGIRQARLADLLEVHPISVARLLDRMEAAGWVERRPDPSDRRAVNLHLKDTVQPILEKMFEFGAEIRAQAFEGIPEEEREKMTEHLAAMRLNLAADAPEDRDPENLLEGSRKGRAKPAAKP
jgi:DNA-binding MarR family transcriptional regulator